MTISTFIALLPALFGLAAFAPAEQEPQVRTVIVQNEIIMRIPIRPPQPAIEWVERDGPKCIRSDTIRGAALSRSGQVDFLLRDRRRLRAELGEDCPGLDFYSGFYLAPEDDQICAGRDTIRSRIGGSCMIAQFHRLVPQKR